MIAWIATVLFALCFGGIAWYVCGGIKIKAGGRINGAEIARVEWSRQGKVPLHTLRENIDYGFAEANTTAGKIGIKVWICKKEDFQPRISGQRRERGERKERK